MRRASKALTMLVVLVELDDWLRHWRRCPVCGRRGRH